MKVKLSQVADIIVGFPFKSDFFNEDGDGVRLVRGMNVTERSLRFGSESRWWNQISSKLDNYYLKENDIVIGMDGSKVGYNFAKIKKEDLPLLLVQRVACVRAKKGYSQSYLWMCISSPLFINYVNTVKTGSSIPHISQKQIGDYSFEIPDSYDEQKQIGSSFELIENKIEINNKINSELESMAKTLFDYWFLQFEFPNEEGKPYKSSGGKMVWNEELKRAIPKGWEAKQIGNIIEEADKSKVQVNTVGNDGKYPFFTSGESILKYNEFFVDGFNIFMNTGGNPDIKAYKGKSAYSTDTWCINANEYSYILYYCLLKMMPQFEQLFFAGSGLKHLQKDAFKDKYILIPNKEILKKFNEKNESIWDEITNCIKQNQEFSSLRDFLLPLLMNGQASV